MAIAPHLNNEVRLVLAGEKPLATIEKRKDPMGYALAIAMAGTGALKIKVHSTKDSPEGEAVFVKPFNAELIPYYLHLLEHGVQELGIKEYHRQMGRLFGYSEQDIEDFIKSEIHCDCAKCRGNNHD